MKVKEKVPFGEVHFELGSAAERVDPSEISAAKTVEKMVLLKMKKKKKT